MVRIGRVVRSLVTWPARRCHLIYQRAKRRRRWDAGWRRADFDPLWLGRGVSPEIVRAVEEGWLPTAGKVLDIGCGQGEVVAWFAQRGFGGIGVDIARSAIQRARELNASVSSTLEFQTLDICAAVPSGGPFSIIVDRGCFHRVSRDDIPNYARNVAAACTPNARFLLFVKAFRGKMNCDRAQERECVVEHVRSALGKYFAIERVAETFLDRFGGHDACRALPALVFWMTRRASVSGHAATVRQPAGRAHFRSKGMPLR